MKLTIDDWLKAIELYEEGYSYNSIAKTFNICYSFVRRKLIRYKRNGIEAIIHGKHKHFTIKQKIESIQRFYNGESKDSIAFDLNTSTSVLSNWIEKYEKIGYNGFSEKLGRPRKYPMKEKEKQNQSKVVVETTAQDKEIAELQAKIKQLEMENAILKKLNALVQTRKDQQKKKK